ncbi:MAG TPA: hypothetical protein ENN92_00790 [candidate division WWE3 bacterium]|uniref:Polymerase nucleotidyl transferase domain-containing protein n=1 Tax=candidate division WWE3 bacterium TaxID=2053526 RepID=A0A7C1HGM8_UNCKA|nr:hypothetical protein [candidate division WWE3 bacterium]
MTQEDLFHHWEFSPKEKENTSEALKESLLEMAEALDKLEEKGLVKGARIVLYGSSVSEFRKPTDIDIMIIYDEAVKIPRYTERKIEEQIASVAEEHQLEDLEIQLLREFSAGAPVEFSVKGLSDYPQEDQGLRLDIYALKKSHFMKKLAMGIPNEQKTAAQLEEEIQSNKTDQCALMEGRYMQYSETPYLDENTERRVVSFPVLMEKLMGQPFDEFDTPYVQEILGKFDTENLLEEYTQWYANQLEIPELQERLINWRKLSQQELLILLKEIMEENAKVLVDKEASSYRTGFTCYIKGINFEQGALYNGAILVHGKNIVQESGEALFREDKNFLHSQHI